MTKNLVSGLILASLAQIWATKTFPWILPLLDVRRCCKLSLYAISRKTNEKKLEKMTKNLVSGLILAPLAQIWAQKFLFVNFISTRC